MDNGGLPVPQLGDENHELIRAWLIDGRLQCALRVGLWMDDENDPTAVSDEIANWGRLVHELLGQIGQAISESHESLDAADLAGQILIRVIDECQANET